MCGVECLGADIEFEQAVFKQFEVALRGQAALPCFNANGVEHQFLLSVCGVAFNTQTAVRACRTVAEFPSDAG